MATVLMVAHYFPFPPQQGAKVDIWSQLVTLNKMGCIVDLVVTDSHPPLEEDVSALHEYVNRMWFVQRDRGTNQLLTLHPFQVQSRRDVKNVVLTREYDVVLLQSEYAAGILKNPTLEARHCILRLHNDEERYFRELAKSTSNMLNKVFYLVESFKFRYYSHKITTASELLLFISEHERQRHLATHPSDANKSWFLPPDVTVESMKPYRDTGTKVLFVGSLTIPTNMHGLQWYIAEIHPKLSLIQGYELVVAGHTNGHSTEWLKKLSSHQTNITLHENVSDLDAIYESAAVFINPILRGAGLKVKTIRALQAGLPVVTTHVGSEGTGLQSGNHLLIAESPSVFADHVRTLLSDRSLSRRLVSSAQAYLAAAFDQEKRMREVFARLLRSDALDSTVPNLHSEELVGS